MVPHLILVGGGLALRRYCWTAIGMLREIGEG